MIRPRRVAASDREDLASVLALMRSEFAYMDGIVDPPSSIRRLTEADLAAGPGEVWAIGAPPDACIVMTPREGDLYIGKLAVAALQRGRGLARALIDHAEHRASELGLASLALETRIELTANQALFATMGFAEIERTAHPGYLRATSITYRRAVAEVSWPTSCAAIVQKPWTKGH